MAATYPTQTAYDLIIDGPETSVGDNTGLFSGSEIPIPHEGITLSGPRRARTESRRARVNGGHHPQILGPEGDGLEVSFSTGVGGSITAGADTVSPAVEHNSMLMASACQHAPIRTEGVDAASATSTVVTSTDGTKHAYSPANYGLAAFETDVGRVVRAYTVSSNDLALKQQIPSGHTVEIGDIIAGGIIVPCAYRWTGELAYSMAARLANLDAAGSGEETDFSLAGCFADWSIPTVQAAGSPQFDWSMMVHGATRGTDLSNASSDPSEAAPLSSEGCQLTLSAYGQTTIAEPCVYDIAAAGNGAFVKHPCRKRGNDYGFNGAVRDAAFAPEIVVTIAKGEATPASLTSGASTYRASFEASRDSGVRDEYQVLADWSFGGLGRIAALYMPCAILWDWTEVVTDGGVIREQLTFRPSSRRSNDAPYTWLFS